jgi:dTDP-4-amino-4,6-dideoxygalactose transaminase
MTELEAAIGRAQLKKMDSIAEKRRAIYEKLKEEFKKELLAFRIPEAEPDSEPNPWFLFVHVDKEKLKADNELLAKAICAEGIPAGQKYVKLELKDIVIVPYGNTQFGYVFLIDTIQKYESNNLKSTTRKNLYLARVNETYKIIGELVK